VSRGDVFLLVPPPSPTKFYIFRKEIFKIANIVLNFRTTEILRPSFGGGLTLRAVGA
jgi:hypothetical protein